MQAANRFIPVILQAAFLLATFTYLPPQCNSNYLGIYPVKQDKCQEFVFSDKGIALVVSHY